METIEEIIKAIDDDLIDRGKSYLLLRQAKKLLEEKGILISEEKLKKILEENKIIHAYQTDSTDLKTKYWRIPLSNEGKLRKKPVKEKKQNIQPDITYQNQSNPSNLTICSNCGESLYIPNEIINEKEIHCPTCDKNFRNPFNKKNTSKINLLTNTKEIEKGCSSSIGISGFVICIGFLLCLTGIGVLIGIPLIIAGILFPFLNIGNSTITGKCPYCGYENYAKKFSPGINCVSCRKRIIIRNGSFFKID